MRTLIATGLVFGSIALAVTFTDRMQWVVLAAAAALVVAACGWSVAAQDWRYLRAVLICAGLPVALTVLPVAWQAQLRASEWRQLLQEPPEISIDALDQAPPLPAYVRLRGVMLPRVEKRWTSTIIDSKGRKSSAQDCRLPMVASGEEGRRLIAVLTSTCAMGRTEGVVEGWLQRFPGEPSLFHQSTADAERSIYLDWINPAVDPTRTLFLDSMSRFSSAFVGVWLLLGGQVVTWLLGTALAGKFWPEPGPVSDLEGVCWFIGKLCDVASARERLRCACRVE